MASERVALQFPLVDRYMGLRLGVEMAGIRPGQLHVVESPRRLAREMSYGYVHALWWVWLHDERTAVSVVPGAGEEVRRIAAAVTERDEFFDLGLAERLKVPADRALRGAGRPVSDRVLSDVFFVCNAKLLRPHRHGDCRRLTDESIAPAEGLRLPTHCFPDGVAYGVVADGRIVSVAFAHRAGVMEDSVADVGVETAPGYRRRGYAQTAVSALVEHFTRSGGEARYGCSRGNVASMATARSVGFVPYGVSLILAAPSA